MTRTRTTDPEPIRTQVTDFGNGFLPNLIRSLLHPLVVHTAAAAGWPITLEQARSSITIALESLSRIPPDSPTLEILGEDGRTAVENWRTALSNLSTQLANGTAGDPLTTTHTRHIHTAYAHAFILLGVLDEDLLGIRSDGGRTP